MPLAAVLLAACTAGSGSTDVSTRQGPVDAETALGTFRIQDGFRIELVAAEPLISDPVAMEIDEEGRLYVVEMHGYPLDTGGSGRIVLLEDSDSDGRADRSTVFAEGLRLPNGIMRWKRGVLVTDSPDLIYLEDVDGDGRADLRKVVLTGFALSNPQHNTNSPIYGLDNWIYLANEGTVGTSRYAKLFGDEGTPVHFPDAPDAAVLPPNAAGRNVRLRPDTHELESLSARSQFGHTFDAWGRHFLVTNSRPAFHEVVPARYLARNPRLPVASAVQDLPDYGSPAEVFPITESPEYQMLTDVGIMTSAAGLTWYLGDLFSPEYSDVAFVTESAHNLVHAVRVRAEGVSFRASRLQADREFLASTDSWFRPVNLYVGPDGALYVLDYYRKIIEHPEWLDDATIEGGELYSGTDLGRIYRVLPANASRSAELDAPRLRDASAAELVAALEHPNLWWRRHAQRLLVDGRGAEAVAPLVRLATESRSAVGRVHALWTLEGLGRLETPLIERALGDESAGVRENAIQLAELHLGEAPALADRLVSMGKDGDARVRLQLLLTLGELDSRSATAERRRLLFAHIEDEWMQVAALSARVVDDAELYSAAVQSLAAQETPGRRAFFERLAAMVGAGGQTEAIRRVVTASLAETPSTAEAWWKAATLDGLATGLPTEAARSPLLEAERERLLGAALRNEVVSVRRAALRLLERIGAPSESARAEEIRRAIAIAPDAKQDPELRADAVRLLALQGAAPHEKLLRERTAPGEPAPVQIAAVRALGTIPGDRVASFFIQRWRQWTPAVRDEAVRALGRDRDRLLVLVGAVENGVVQPSELTRQTRTRLMMAPDEQLRVRARALFRDAFPGAAEAVEEYSGALALQGDADRGRSVFARVCSSCHQYRGSGTAFGPDLAQVRHRPRLSLLTDVVDPSRSLADGFELWTVERADGSTLSGLIVEETPTLLTLRHAGGGETGIPRSDIVSMEASDVSAMPEGLQTQIGTQEMADLLAFLREGR